MGQDEFILDADTDHQVDLSGNEPLDNINPTKDVTHSILEPMKIEPLRLPKSVIDEMKSSYDEVCLNDFKDMYHMSEEERKQTFQFYEVFRELRMIKIKHRTLDSFVNAYRVMMKALNAVAEVNGVYSKETFVKKVLKGKIQVSGLKKPKYIGRNKKDINWELVSEYIMNPELDPKDLAKKKNEAFFDIVTEEDIKELEFTLGDLSTYMNNSDDTPESYLDEVDLDEDDVTGKNIVQPMSKKEQRKLFKDNRVILMGVKDARKLSNGSSKRIYSSFAYELTQDAFAEIKERDESSGRIKIPKFKGSALKKSDIDAYFAVLEEYERNHTQVEIDGRYYSMDEADEIELKKLLEANGYDIRKFYSYKEDEKKMLKQKKKDKKKIERLKKSLRAAKKRYEERDSGGKVNGKKKKKSKKSKKVEKTMTSYMTPGGYGNFDDYAKSMESWGD